MKTTAVVLKEPEHIALSVLDLTKPSQDDAIVDIAWSGVSTGTERLLWSGSDAAVPRHGLSAGSGLRGRRPRDESARHSPLRAGQMVFVPGARCYGDVRGLFGAASSRVVVPANKLVPIDEQLGEQGILLALAATAYHALSAPARQAAGSHRRSWHARAPARATDTARWAANRRSFGSAIRSAPTAPWAIRWSIPPTMPAAIAGSSAMSAATRLCSTR